MTQSLDADAQDLLFRKARTHNEWAPATVSQALLREVYELAKWGPTSANVSPARFVFLTTPAAKARLAPHLSDSNRPKAMQAPVCVIIAHDLNFADKIPELFPHNPGAAAWFADPRVAEITALRNGTLQGAYLMLAARTLGLNCGPMSGFNNDGVDAEFFAGRSLRSNFICNIGYGAETGLFPRSPRLSFETACEVM